MKVSIHMYIYLYAVVWEYFYIYTNIYTYALFVTSLLYTYLLMYIYTNIHMCVYIHIHTYVFMYLFMFVCICFFKCSHIYIYSLADQMRSNTYAHQIISLPLMGMCTRLSPLCYPHQLRLQLYLRYVCVKTYSYKCIHIYISNNMCL
jgi:hypothetical protein